MAIDIYYAPASAPARAVVMTAKHIGLDINLKTVDLRNGEHLKPEYLKMNPQHCVPTIDDNGFYLWESRAIMTYFLNKYAPDSNLYPKDPQKRALVDRLLYFDIGTLYKAEGEYLYPFLFFGKPKEAEKEENFKKALSLLETFLSQTAYVAGDHLTLGDLSIISSLSFIEILDDYDFSGFPKVSAWMKKVKGELPYYKEINEDPLNAFKVIFKK